MISDFGNFDYIIVGAGSAGCVLANRLSKDNKVNVLLLEAGGNDWNPWIHIPAGYFRTLHNPATDWCYKTTPEPALNGRSIEWPRGKVLGGSSSINGLLYIRGQDSDYNYWRQLGNKGWSASDVLPYFKRAECHSLGSSKFHGEGGPLSVELARNERKISDALISGAEELGIPKNKDFNGENQEGAGYFQTTTKNGRRCSAAVAYLNPAKKRPNLTIVTHAHAEKLIYSADDNANVSGVSFFVKKQAARATLRAGGEVVISAGAIGSPQLLQLSGIGPVSLLKDLGIPVRRNLSGVGCNLQDHLQIRLVFEVNVPTLNDDINNLFRRSLIGLEYIFFRTGPMAMGASHVCIFTKTNKDLETPDIQFHYQPLSANKPGLKMHNFSGITLSVCQLRPESRGKVMISSTDPLVHPEIHPNYLSTKLDQETVVAGIKIARKLADSPSFSPYIVKEKIPGPSFTENNELLMEARNIGQTIYHPTGTCKMGSESDSVVNDRLLVHGFKNLRVVDASIMPSITSGNTNAPTIMIGEKASDMILEDRIL